MIERAQCERGWCILRTSPGRTLPLARSLASAGFDIWTPKLVISRRRPRSKKTIEFDAPILPTFVFARARHLADLIAVMAMPISTHPPFSIFRYAGRFPLLRDEQMDGLHLEEDAMAAARQMRLDREARAVTARNQRERTKILRQSTPLPPIGARVRSTVPAFTGLVGEVEGSRGKKVLVNFGGTRIFKIDAWQLIPDQIENVAA